MNKSGSSWQQWLGIEPGTTSHSERLAAAFGGFMGIYFVYLVTSLFVDASVAPLIVASMGASAVLLFAVPHGALSQPWPLLAGHLVSAVIGVLVAKLVPDLMLAAALAVSLAILVMYYLRCVHPPGGASALMAVIGGPSVHTLGFQYVLTPVMLNAVIIFVVAVAVNYLFTWRRYPLALMRREQLPVAECAGAVFEEQDIAYALGQVDSLVDISEQELARIYSLARQHAREQQLQAEDILPGAIYSNGRQGAHWAIRQIIDASDESDADKAQVIYKVLAGYGAYSTATCTRQEFARWARYPVRHEGDSWQRVEVGDKQS